VKKTAPYTDVQWQENFTLEDLRGKDVSIEFELKDAKLFSFDFK
jgi:hypothetical protein